MQLLVVKDRPSRILEMFNKQIQRAPSPPNTADHDIDSELGLSLRLKTSTCQKETEKFYKLYLYISPQTEYNRTYVSPPFAAVCRRISAAYAPLLLRNLVLLRDLVLFATRKKALLKMILLRASRRESRTDQVHGRVFANVEARANQVYTTVKENYLCLVEIAKSRTSFRPSVAWMKYQKSKWCLVFYKGNMSSEGMKLQDVGGENLDASINKNTYNISDPVDLEELHAILCILSLQGSAGVPSGLHDEV